MSSGEPLLSNIGLQQNMTMLKQWFSATVFMFAQSDDQHVLNCIIQSKGAFFVIMKRTFFKHNKIRR